MLFKGGVVFVMEVLLSMVKTFEVMNTAQWTLIHTHSLRATARATQSSASTSGTEVTIWRLREPVNCAIRWTG